MGLFTCQSIDIISQSYPENRPRVRAYERIYGATLGPRYLIYHIAVFRTWAWHDLRFRNTNTIIYTLAQISIRAYPDELQVKTAVGDNKFQIVEVIEVSCM